MPSRSRTRSSERIRRRIAAVLGCLTGLLPALASAEPRLGRFIGVIDGVPEVTRVVFADERTAYALHAGEPPVLRLMFDDGETMPRLERLSIAKAREAAAPDELWYGSVDASHPLWVDPPPIGLITPIDIARDSNGSTLLLDRHSNALHRYDKQAASWRSIGGWGAFPGLFAHPSAVAAAGGRIYVADMRNHRIQVFNGRLSYLGEWGLHIVRPHEDEGHLHYPAEIAVSGDGALAIVAESMQDRLQIFGRVREGEAGAIAEPMFERETIAHFGPHAARDGQLMVTTEPDRPGVIVWDLSRPLPIMIGQIVGHGDGFGLFRSVGDVALSVDGPNGMPRVWVLDPALQRLQVFDLDWSPEKVLGFDPFMARFVRAFDLAALLGRNDARIKGLLLRDDGSLVLHDVAQGALIVTDARLRRARTLDGLHEPGEWVRLSAGHDANTAALLHAHTGVIDLVGLSGEHAGERTRLDLLETQQEAIGSGSIDYAALLFVERSGRDTLWVADRRSSRVIRYPFDAEELSVGAPDLVLGVPAESLPGRSLGHPRERLGGGLFHKPSGLLLDNFGHLIVIDEGNHRIQFFDGTGRFLDTYGALWYTQAARRGAPGRVDH